MAVYNRGIVAIRKLNENNKAGLGRRGDTKIRKVDNRESHVNALEAYLIDVNGKAGEDYAKRVGAGTINPFTGMPEYHEGNHQFADHQAHVMVNKMDDDGNSYQEEDFNQPLYTAEELASPGGQDVLQTAIGTYSPGEGQLGYDQYAGLSDEQRQAYLGEFDIGVDKLKYISPFETKPFELLEQGAALDMKQKGLEAKEFGRIASQGSRASISGGKGASSQANLATSGTITNMMQTQLTDLTKDYQAGMAETGLGMERVGFGLEQDIYTEQQRQMEKLWTQIGTVAGA